MTTSSIVKDNLSIPPLSQSRYELMACPAAYVEQIIRGVHEPPNPFSVRGTVVHQKLSQYVNHLVKNRIPEDVDAFEVLVGDSTGEAWQILNSMRGLKIDPERVLGTELRLLLDEKLEPIDADDENANPAAFEGTIDRLDSPDASTIEVHDYKSYWNVFEPDTYQSRHYPLLVFQHYPDVETVRFVLQFVRFGVSRFVEFHRDRDLARLKKEAQSARMRQLKLHWAYIRGEEAEAMPNPGCVYCPMLTDGCPVKNNPYNEQSPEDLAKFVMWAEQSRKKAIGLLKDFVMARGPVQITDANGKPYVAQFHLTEKSGYPVATCFEQVMLHDPELASKLTLSGLSQKLEAKKRAGLKEVLEPEKIVTPGSRFGFKELSVEQDAEE